eukprot:TRINITY_DN28244_c0_g1_i1.p2 TRINITY_DN28244_c0_g1~~TRINITY_DN28244_c0_g1_i1.p2  ORF type:complete len:113 (+),score=6.80 TRINITY_DN28244_c0_g1_i1:570-908(+)
MFAVASTAATVAYWEAMAAATVHRAITRKMATLAAIEACSPALSLDQLLAMFIFVPSTACATSDLPICCHMFQLPIHPLKQHSITDQEFLTIGCLILVDNEVITIGINATST